MHMLRYCMPVDDVRLHLFYQSPLASSSSVVHENFAANRWSVTRQVHHSVTHPGRSVDMVLFLNGLPIVTLELKNPWTGQTARYHGQLQYRKRDARQTLFRFGRVLVHMAVDTDDGWRTTRLAWYNTFVRPYIYR